MEKSQTYKILSCPSCGPFLTPAENHSPVVRCPCGTTNAATVGAKRTTIKIGEKPPHPVIK